MYAPARESLRAWYAEAAAAQWGSPDDVKRQFPRASIFTNNRVVFDIAVNTHRLIVSINYRHHAAYIKFFGTHAQYDRVDAGVIDQTGTVHGKKNR
jgi:mRNA interferase HigB